VQNEVEKKSGDENQNENEKVRAEEENEQGGGCFMVCAVTGAARGHCCGVFPILCVMLAPLCVLAGGKSSRSSSNRRRRRRRRRRSQCRSGSPSWAAFSVAFAPHFVSC
jgi:hypothetical protein